jgi:hypothetical protein
MKTIARFFSPHKTPLVAFGILFIIACGYLWYRAGNNVNKAASNDTADASGEVTKDTQIKIPTQTVTTEGKDIQVPTNVDPSSIKNYTLITENENYKIRTLNGTYVITLYPIVNSPDGVSYNDQLKQFKKEALNYLGSRGVDTTNITIVYDPPAAANL